ESTRPRAGGRRQWGHRLGITQHYSLSQREVWPGFLLDRGTRAALVRGPLMDWSLATLQPDFRDLFWGLYRTPAEKRDWPRINTLVARCADHFRLLDRHLSGSSNLAGNRLCMADIPAGTALYRYFELEIEHPAVPNLTAWYERLQIRAPYRQHVMIPFDDL